MRRLSMGIEFAPRLGTRPAAGVPMRCRPGALTGRKNTDNNPMHRRVRRVPEK